MHVHRGLTDPLLSDNGSVSATTWARIKPHQSYLGATTREKVWYPSQMEEHNPYFDNTKLESVHKPVDKSAFVSWKRPPSLN